MAWYSAKTQGQLYLISNSFGGKVFGKTDGKTSFLIMHLLGAFCAKNA